MDLFKINLFRGVVKTGRFLLSPPKAYQSCMYISDAGTATKELLPIVTGLCKSDNAKKAWAVLHQLKLQVYQNGEQIEGETLLIITDRSYFPMDAFGIFTEKKRANLASLDDIALNQHDKAVTDTSKQATPQTQLQQFIITACFVIVGLFALLATLKGCG